MQKVTVIGWAEQKKVLKTVRKSGRRAELWPYPYNPEYHAFTRHYFASPKPSSSYNYYKHGYSDGEDFGYYHKPIGATMINDKAVSMFSNDNPHACSIMWSSIHWLINLKDMRSCSITYKVYILSFTGTCCKFNHVIEFEILLKGSKPSITRTIVMLVPNSDTIYIKTGS